jgi:uncharacterized protein HemX
MNSSVQYDNLLPKVRYNIKRIESKLRNMSPAARQYLLRQAQIKFAGLPPGEQAMARDIIDREQARGAGPRGLGVVGAAANTASTIGNIAAIIGTIGTIGLSVYQLTEQRKDRKAAESQASQQAELQRRLANEQIEAERQRREMEQRRFEAEQAAYEREMGSRLALQSAQIQQGQSPAAVVPGQPGVAPAGGMSTGTKVAIGAAAAAGALLLAKG